MSTPSICLLTDQKCGTDRTNKERKKEKSTLQWDQQNFEIFVRIKTYQPITSTLKQVSLKTQYPSDSTIILIC